VRLRVPTLGDQPALAAFFDQLHQYGTGGASETIGWCDVWDRDRSGRCFWLDVRAHPRVEATYEALLDFGLQRAGEQAGKGAVARLLVATDDEALAGVTQHRAFRPVRYAFRMVIDLLEKPACSEWPEGISVRAYRAEDAQTVYELEAEIFADDWNFTQLDFDDWQRLHLASMEFDPDLWFLAEDAGEVAGCALCRSERRPGTGHVNALGVRPQWRRRGLGLALLLHSFAELRAHGRSKADLGVDAENPTGALPLYERAGMRLAQRTDTYEKILA
jgi:ribosomal protein S18 acetylase RimI-like enzyme